MTLSNVVNNFNVDDLSLQKNKCINLIREDIENIDKTSIRWQFLQTVPFSQECR